MKPIGWITCDLCGKSQEELEETQYGWMCLDCYVKKLRADLARVTENYNTLLDAYVAGVNEAATETVSERCRRIGVQSCGFCEDAACGDNTNPTIDAMKADLARVTGERDAVMENDVKFRGEHIYLEGLKKDCLRLLDQRDKYMDKCDALTADNARVKGELSGADDAGYQCYLAHQPDPKPSYIEWLKKGMEYLEEAAHAAAQGHSPAEYLATQAPTTLRDELARVKGERDEARKLVHNINEVASRVRVDNELKKTKLELDRVVKGIRGVIGDVGNNKEAMDATEKR